MIQTGLVYDEKQKTGDWGLGRQETGALAISCKL